MQPMLLLLSADIPGCTCEKQVICWTTQSTIWKTKLIMYFFGAGSHCSSQEPASYLCQSRKEAEPSHFCDVEPWKWYPWQDSGSQRHPRSHLGSANCHTSRKLLRSIRPAVPEACRLEPVAWDLAGLRWWSGSAHADRKATRKARHVALRKPSPPKNQHSSPFQQALVP